MSHGVSKISQQKVYDGPSLMMIGLTVRRSCEAPSIRVPPSLPAGSIVLPISRSPPGNCVPPPVELVGEPVAAVGEPTALLVGLAAVVALTALVGLAALVGLTTAVVGLAAG